VPRLLMVPFSLLHAKDVDFWPFSWRIISLTTLLPVTTGVPTLYPSLIGEHEHPFKNDLIPFISLDLLYGDLVTQHYSILFATRLYDRVHVNPYIPC